MDARSVTESSEGEEFFAQDFYMSWLHWVRAHADTHPSARQLATWLAEEWELLFSAVASYSANEVARRTLRLLDVGCGFGRHIVGVLATHDSWEGIGIDINPSMISAARKLAEKEGVLDRVAFAVGDASELLRLPSSSFDLAICMTNTLGNLPGRKRLGLLRRLSQLLRPGACALVSTYSTSADRHRVASYEAIGLIVEEGGSQVATREGLRSQSFDPVELMAMVEAAGLEVARLERPGEIGVAVLARRPKHGIE